ncbi:hypothetical protein TNCV_543791 [Trichonephila clavipes]|nr:hypothetical protein TNCV_543791 [Trichonephila clavipes]
MSVPQDLLDFYFTLIAGSNQKRKDNSKCMRQVKSYYEVVVYGVHNGKVKTSKHIMLGMSLKSVTSSLKIIDIIHRYGHCISYPGVEELETEVTYTSVQNSSICPETIVKYPLLCTGVTFDNFDRFVETKSGKDTLHDTVGIIYQNVELHTPNESQFVNLLAVNEETVISKKRRRRTFEAITVDMQEEPVAKRRKNYMDLSAHYVEYSLPVNLQLYKTIDTVWIISNALKLPNVPTWSVVLETMKQSKKMCEEVKQSSIQVTYDLAIAKVALQIQATKKSDFDNLFIHSGAFHIMMASFKAAGKVIIDCGLTNVRVQSNLLACCSVSGFLEAKHLNRFFICNQPNYARWASKYYDSLMKIAETHPDLFEEFQKGFFGIQRTYKPFSKQPIDLVLEQTINADAARRLTTNSISARQRWALSHDIRSTIISCVYKDLDLQIEQQLS